jgi:hypothetical protein
MSEPVKPGWGEVPAEALPLRARLPQFRQETRTKLCAWGLRQGEAVRRWVMQRAAAYYDTKLARTPEEIIALDATCCLDLLRWQCGGVADKEAVERLPEDNEVKK